MTNSKKNKHLSEFRLNTSWRLDEVGYEKLEESDDGIE